MLQVVKFLLEGLAVAMASHLVAGGKLDVKEIVMLGLTAAAVFMVLEYYAPSVAVGARHGAGFGIGAKMVGGGYFSPVDDDQGPSGYSLAEYAQVGGYDEDELVAPKEEVIPSPNSPYKLIDGMYSHKTLLAGFNESAKAANSSDNCKNQSRYPWSSDAGGQVGGSSEEISEATAEEEAKPQSEVVERDDNYRKAGALYSGDLVDVIMNDFYLQRGMIDSQIVFDKALPKIGTNLSKLRLVHPNHSKTKQTMLQYGEPVYLMHNTYFNNMNVPKFIKYGERLQSHQDGPLFRTFKVFDANNKDKKGAIEPGTEVYLCRGDQEGDNVFLKVEDNKTVTSKNTVDKAARFKITLKRVYEAHDRNLCVCSNEVIYP
jgi:hypothetical protein